MECVFQIINEAEKRKRDGERLIIAIDGRCGSGKSSLAVKLSEKLSCPIIKTDDFFLQPFQRTPERLNEPGGNIDYERFIEEAVNPAAKRSDFFYRQFSCTDMKLKNEKRIPYSDFLIIEGTYSHHPIFGEYADLRVFLSVSGETQIERLKRRDGEKKAEMFRRKWIPMEEQYFSAFKIMEKADMIIKA